MNEKELELSAPQEEILRSTAQRILVLAGQGGGKSHLGGYCASDLIINFPKVRGFIGANTYGQLTKSTLDRIFKVWLEEFGWTKDIEYVVDKIPPSHFKIFGPKLKSYENTISFNNGCLVFLGSLDNFMAIDGSEFGWAFLDETKDTKEEAVKEVITARLRQPGMWVHDVKIIDHKEEGATSWNPLYVLTSPAKVRWINEWFRLDDKYDEISKKIFSETDYYSLVLDDLHVVIYSTYHNIKNLPENYITQRLSDLKGSPHLIDMLIYGSPIAKSGGEFFSQFKRLGHVKKVDFIPEDPVHISLDFNVSPYITMTCWQITRDKDKFKVTCFDEFCLSSPNNNTEALCKAFELKYLYNKKVPIFYYGDASGSNQNTVSKEHNFDVLERVLRGYLNDNSKRVMKKNPSVIGTRDFVNKILADGLPIDISISDKCKNLIADLEFMKEAPDGGKLIEKAKDPVTNATYEKYGHTSDSLRYFLVSAFSSYYKPD